MAPDNLPALVGSPAAMPHEGQAEQAHGRCSPSVPAKDKGNAEIVAHPGRPSSISPRQAKAAGPIGELKAKAEKDPKDFQSRLDLAMAYWAGE